MSGPLLNRLREQKVVGYYDDGFCMVGSDGSYQSRPATPCTLPHNRDGSEAIAVIEALCQALERLHRNFNLLLGGKPVRDVAETEAEVRNALAKARGEQS